MEAINTPKEFDNKRVVEELQHYCTFSEAVQDYPFLDNIITGVCNLDLGGNTRPLSTAVVYTLLATQSLITTKLIAEAAQCSERHAQKICGCLRVAAREVEKHLDKFPNKYVYNGGMWPQKEK